MKKITSIVLTLVMVVSILGVSIIAPVAVQASAASISIGQYVQMGSYYGEPILWRCVDIDENGPLMLADKIISIKPYDANGTNTSGSHGRGYTYNGTKGYYRQQYGSDYWADSNMRMWLNSTASAGNVQWLCGNAPTNDKVWNGYNDYAGEKGFLADGNFNASERNAIKTVKQKSLLNGYEYSSTINPNYHIFDDNISSVVQNYETAYSEQITDKMFLLDVKQVNRVYQNRNIIGTSYYIGQLTQKAVDNSEYKNAYLSTGKNWGWWLRSPNADYTYGYDVRCVSCVGSYGYVSFGDGADNGYSLGVRPAFYINLSSAIFTSGTGAAGSPYVVKGGYSDGVQLIKSDLQNEIEINGQGIGYAYYRIVNVKNGLESPLANRTVTYSYTGYSDVFTAPSDSNGNITIRTPYMGNSKQLTLNITAITGTSSVSPSQSISVLVTPLSFEQEWNATVGTGGGASVGIGVGGKIGVAEAEAKIAEIGAKANSKPSMKIKNSYDKGSRNIEITNTLSNEVSVNAKAGLFGKVNVAKTGVEITPAGIKGDAGIGSYSSIGIKIDDYNPNNADHISKIGNYLFNTAVTSNGQNVVTQKILEFLNFNAYNKTTYGTKIKLGAGAELGAVELPIGSSSGKSITLAGGSGTTVFTYDATLNTNGEKNYKSGYKTDGKISFGDMSIINMPIFAKSFIGNDTTFTANFNGSGIKDSLELEGIGENSSNQISWYSETKSKYAKLKYTGNELDGLYNGNNNIKGLFNGTKGFFGNNDILNTIDYAVASGAKGNYSISTKKEKGIDIELTFGLKALLGAEVSIFLSGIESVGFDTEKGILINKKNFKSSESAYIESLVDNQKQKLSTVLTEPINGISNIVGNFFSKIGNSIANGVQNGAAAIKGAVDDTTKRVINIFKPNTPVQLQKSYMLMALQNEIYSLNQSYIAVTVGEPYVVVMSDEVGNEIAEFEPLTLEINYDDTMLATAGISSDSILVESLKIYYWDASKKSYICKGGVLDKINKKVSLDITKGGQYILAIDNLSPDITDFVVSDNTNSPTITAFIKDISGINTSGFKFDIDGNTVVSGDNFNNYYDYETGKFTYKNSLPLSEGQHIASIFASDTSGNALPQAKICQFIVDSQPPTITNFNIPQNINAGSELQIGANVTEADRVILNVAYPNESGWSDYETLSMTNEALDKWSIIFKNTYSSDKLKISLTAYDTAGNKTESTEAIVNINANKTELENSIQKLNSILKYIEEGDAAGFYQTGTKDMLINVYNNAMSVKNNDLSTQEMINASVANITEKLIELRTLGNGNIFLDSVDKTETTDLLNYKLNLYNTATNSINAKIVVAIYNGNKLISIKFIDSILESNKNTTCFVAFDKNKIPNNYKAKVLILNSVTDVKPLTRGYDIKDRYLLN